MPQDLRLFLYAAMSSQIGLLLQTSDTARARQLLYRARVEAADPDLKVLQFRTSPVEGGDLIIVKETVQVESQPDPGSAEESGL